MHFGLGFFTGLALAGGCLAIVKPIAWYNLLGPSSEGAPFTNRAIVSGCSRGHIPSPPLVLQGVGRGPCKQLLQKADLFGWHFNLCSENLFGLFVMDRGAR
jgi:hypothetical protein